jgi:HK97 gp10 family phage protein
VIETRLTWSNDPIKAVENLAVEVGNKFLRIAMNKAMAPLKELAVAGAPVKTGALKASLRIKVKSTNAGMSWYGLVGPSTAVMSKIKGYKKPTLYAWPVERGSKHNTKRAFLQAAFDQGHSTTEQVFFAKLGELVDEYLRTNSKG